MKIVPSATGSTRLRLPRSLKRLIRGSSWGTVMGTWKEVLRKSVRARFRSHSSMGFVTEDVSDGKTVRFNFMRGTSVSPFSISRVSVGWRESKGLELIASSVVHMAVTGANDG